MVKNSSTKPVDSTFDNDASNSLPEIDPLAELARIGDFDFPDVPASPDAPVSSPDQEEDAADAAEDTANAGSETVTERASEQVDPFGEALASDVMNDPVADIDHAEPEEPTGLEQSESVQPPEDEADVASSPELSDLSLETLPDTGEGELPVASLDAVFGQEFDDALDQSQASPSDTSEIATSEIAGSAHAVDEARFEQKSVGQHSQGGSTAFVSSSPQSAVSDLPSPVQDVSSRGDDDRIAEAADDAVSPVLALRSLDEDVPSSVGRLDIPEPPEFDDPVVADAFDLDNEFSELLSQALEPDAYQDAEESPQGLDAIFDRELDGSAVDIEPQFGKEGTQAIDREDEMSDSASVDAIGLGASRTLGNESWEADTGNVAAAIADPSLEDQFSEDFDAVFRDDAVKDDPIDEDEFVPSAPVARRAWVTKPWIAENRRASMIALAVLGVAVVGALGAVSYQFLGSSTEDGAPVIVKADDGPIKEQPAERGGNTVPNQDKAVYDRVANGDNAVRDQERLVTSQEEPVDIIARTLPAGVQPLDQAVAEPSSADVASAAPDPSSAGAAGSGTTTDAITPGLAPRRVKTLIVRPDGSIVTQEAGTPAVDPAPDTVASVGSEPALPPIEPNLRTGGGIPLPVFRAPAAPVPPTETDSVSSTPPEAPLEVAQPVSEPSLQDVVADASRAGGPATDPVAVSPPPLAPLATAEPVAEPPAVADAPAGSGAVPVVAAETSVEAPAAAAEPAAVAPGSYLVQISSQPTRAAAEQSYRNLSARYSSVIGGKGVSYQQAEIAGKGTFHRVRIPAGTQAEANSLCARYKSAGGSCLVTRQ